MSWKLEQLTALDHKKCRAQFSTGDSTLVTTFHVSDESGFPIAVPDPDIFVRGFDGSAAQLRLFVAAVHAFVRAADGAPD